MESKHRKCRESDIIYHDTSHILLQMWKSLLMHLCITNLLFMARADHTSWGHAVEHCTAVLSPTFGIHVNETICNKTLNLQPLQMIWFMKVIPLFKCHNKHWHMHSETPGKWQVLSPYVLVAFIKTISMPYALWKHACIYLTPLET